MSVVVEGLTKSFIPGATPAVSDISFQAPSGAITALLGPSGAGKSTILRLIAGLERPDCGRVLVEGEDCTRRAIQKRGVGFVFQSYGLFDHLSVAQNIGFGLAIRRAPAAHIERRVAELLGLIQLEDFGSRRPAQLSGGQRQRVAFARALAVDPKVLLLDEPFGALDAKVRVELREWLRRLHAETRVTTLLVTHDQDEAFSVAEHVVVILDGKVAQQGAPREVFDRPASPRVAGFVAGTGVLRARTQLRLAEAGRIVPAAPAEGGRHGGVVLGRIERVSREGDRLWLAVRTSGGPVTIETRSYAEVGLAEGDYLLVDPATGSALLEDYAI